MKDSPTWLRHPLLHAALVIAATAAVAVYLGWPSLVQADRFHENWRQSPQWLSPDKQFFQDDDLLLRYAEFGTSPFGNALYKNLALTGHDIVWGKVMTIVVFALGALSCFLAANAMSGLVAGWAAVVLFLFFPAVYEHFVGGFMACFSWPLLGFAVLLIYRQRWWWSIPLIAFSAFVYPMVGIHIGVMYALDALYHDVRTGRVLDRDLWRTKLLPLALAAVALVAILGSKYFEDHGFGDLVTRADMQDRIEFTKEGRYRILPTTALWTRFERHWENSFHFPLFLAAVFFLGRSAFRMPRGVYSLLAASIIMYYVADYFVMQLYLPSRYIRRSLPLFSCLVGGIWWARIYFDSRPEAEETASKAPPQTDELASAAPPQTDELASTAGDETPQTGEPIAPSWWRLRSLAPLAAVTIVLAGLGIREFGDELEPGEQTRTFDRHGLYDAIRELPGRPMIAAWPRLASEIPLMTGRTVLINKEQAHPWWTGLWDEMTERTQEFWRACYTADPAELRRVVEKYDVDYWIVEPRYYRRGYINKRRTHYQPLRGWLKNWVKRLPRGHRPLLLQVPPAYHLYRDERHYIVSSADLFKWLEAR